MTTPVPGSECWTSADLDRMPDDGLRYEVLNGQLVVNAFPTPRHQWVIKRLESALEAVRSDGYEVMQGVGVLIGDDEPIPDLIVVSGPIDWDGRGIPVEQVELAVEVVSKSTTLQDRMVKPVLYSEAGIPNYWRFEFNPFKGQLPGESLPVAFVHALGGDSSYEPTHRVAAGEKVTVRTPFEFTIDPAALLP
ncbi:Uma2 family endonuclease [Nocardia sp. NPDC050793]|uniref:Uma2 family endonuclease n=1 Tax=Nocardia sp. NPDC050793 TaxID=3155159 RepID=UPI00340F06F1